MSEITHDEALVQVNSLIQNAEKEERKYNWDNTIKLLKKAEKISLDNNLREFEAEIYYKLGEIYLIAADFQKTKELAVNNLGLSISNFQKAYEIFNQLNKEKTNSSLGFINLLKYILEYKEDSGIDLLENARNNFKKEKELKINNKNSIKMAISEFRALVLLIGENLIRIGAKKLLKELNTEFEELISYIWEELEEYQDFPEIYIYQFLKSIRNLSGWIVTLFPAGLLNIEDFIISTMKKLKNFIIFLEKTSNILSLFYGYIIFAFFNLLYSKYYSKNQFEEKLYLKKAQKWLKKGETCIIQANHALSLFYYCSFTISLLLTSLGYFSKDFKSALVDLDYLIVSGSLSFPKITITQVILDATESFLEIALSTNRSITDKLRIIFAEKALELIDLPTMQLSLLKDPKYRIFNLMHKYKSCVVHCILGDLLKDQDHLQTAVKLYLEIPNFIHPKYNSTNSYYSEYLYFISRTGLILAKDASDELEKIDYYHITIDLLENTPREFQTLENMFLLGDTYFELGKLKNEEKIYKKSYNSYIEAIKYCRNKGFFNLIGTAYNNLAQIEDRLGNYLSATENYKKSIEFFEKAMLTISSRFSHKIENSLNYVKAWQLIELAKSNHIKEEHKTAQKHYGMASQLLSKIREYKFEAPFYSAWAELEKAEYLSKNGKHEESAAAYLISKKGFEEAEKTFNSYLKKQRIPEIKTRISKLIQVARVRDAYCMARHQIETARIESKKGNNLGAAELYDKAGEIFRTLCESFKIQKEKNELTGIYYLCNAWKNMEEAFIEQKSEKYAIAAELFKKTSKIFPESLMKKLSIGNAQYCNALRYGTLFDSSNLEEKIDFYRKIKIFLRDSARNYQLGGFKQDAQWALATSTFFDALWYLIKLDNEIELSKKNKHLNVAIYYLESAKDMFDKAGYEQKKEDVLKYLDMIKKERASFISALKIIEKPQISESSIGISAPSCPIEISSSMDVGDMQKTDLTTESELNWFKRIHHLYFYLRDGACIFDHSFKIEKDIPPALVAGGLTGISSLIQYVTRTDTNIRIIEQEDMDIIFEHGKFVSAALITEENLITLRNKLKESVKKIEDLYNKELKTYRGNISVFSKVGQIALKFFEN